MTVVPGNETVFAGQSRCSVKTAGVFDNGWNVGRESYIGNAFL